MAKQKQSGRRGRIDEIDDFADLDPMSFNGGVNVYGGPVMEGGFKAGADYFRSIVEKWGFTELGDVADIGAGYGRWSVFLAEVNTSVHGFEKVAPAVEVARKLAAFLELENLESDEADVTALPAADESFDAVWCYNVLGFVNRAKALTEMNRILKPGGPLLIGAYNSLGAIFDRFFDGYASGGVTHRKARFALQTLKQDPMFDDSNGSYGSEANIGEVLRKYGFELSSSHPVEMRMPSKPAKIDAFADELQDLQALGLRLETDPEFAAEFASHPEIARAFPLSLTASATKVATV